MSKVVLHPKMTMAQLRDFCARHQCGVEVQVTHHHPVVLADFPEPSVFFGCERCSWIGSEPLWVNTQNHFQPPIGEVPCCPECLSFHVSLTVTEEVFHAP